MFHGAVRCGDQPKPCRGRGRGRVHRVAGSAQNRFLIYRFYSPLDSFIAVPSSILPLSHFRALVKSRPCPARLRKLTVAQSLAYPRKGN
jgi:hypothetical protein